MISSGVLRMGAFCAIVGRGLFILVHKQHRHGAQVYGKFVALRKAEKRGQALDIKRLFLSINGDA
ncbi:MAG: hypothetical protein ACN6PV_07130 [Achromobacter sp.]|uniref:hypothetical protein n=1 Tax=Achromobacter sp. TaxID=134375 RepID=UPI003CFCC231